MGTLSAMVSRRGAALVTLLLVVAVLGYEVRDWNDPPEVTVTNGDDTAYRVTAYTVGGAPDPDSLTFRATLPDGSRRTVPTRDVTLGGPYTNVTLETPNVTRQVVTVPPRTTVNATVEAWTHGRGTVYVIEQRATGALVTVEVVDCDRGGQRHALTIRDGLLAQWTDACH